MKYLKISFECERADYLALGRTHSSQVEQFQLSFTFQSYSKVILNILSVVWHLKKVDCFILHNLVDLAFKVFRDFVPSLVLSRNKRILNMVRPNGHLQILLKKYIVQNIS